MVNSHFPCPSLHCLCITGSSAVDNGFVQVGSGCVTTLLMLILHSTEAFVTHIHNTDTGIAHVHNTGAGVTHQGFPFIFPGGGDRVRKGGEWRVIRSRQNN